MYGLMMYTLVMPQPCIGGSSLPMDNANPLNSGSHALAVKWGRKSYIKGDHMLPQIKAILEFRVDIGCGDGVITTPWVGTVSAHLDNLNSNVIDGEGNVWMVTWDEEHRCYIGVPNLTWYLVRGKTPPRLESFLESNIIH